MRETTDKKAAETGINGPHFSKNTFMGCFL